MENSKQPTRRNFVEQASTLAGLGAVMQSSALSDSCIIGANDRISLGHIGIGHRGSELAGMAPKLKDKYNFDLPQFAICGALIASVRPIEARKITGAGRERSNTWTRCWS